MNKPYYLTLRLFPKSSLVTSIRTGLWLVFFMVVGSMQVSGQNLDDVVVSGSNNCNASATYSFFATFEKPSFINFANGIDIFWDGNRWTIGFGSNIYYENTADTPLPPCGEWTDVGNCGGTVTISGGCSTVMSVTCPPTANVWYVNAAAADGGDGSSWDCAFNNLQDALTAASSGQEIWVAEGIYKPGDTRASSFVMKEGVAIYGGFPADGDPTAQDRDFTAYPTILSGEIGSTAQNDNILSVVRGGAGLTAAAVLDGFVVEEGYSNNFPNRRYGGGLFLFTSGSNDFTNPTIRNCVFQDNFADTGPAVCVRVQNGSSGAPTFENCTFNNNNGKFGNSVWMSNNCSATFENCNFDNNTGNTGVNVQTGNTVFNNCSFTNNMANNFGAAIWARGNLTLNNCYFEKNNGPSNGALRLQQSNIYNISNCTFFDNTSDNNGGAIFALDCSPFIENCDFTENHANGLGGAVFNNNASGRFVNCTFSSNMAQRGGALFNNGNGNKVAEPTLINCLFDSNTATTQGGAMVNESNSGQDAVPTLINCTLYGNSAGNTGDAICNIAGGSAVLRNTILFSNGGSGAIFNNGATIVDATNSLFDAEVSGYSSAPTNYTSENNPFVDPENGNFELNDCAAAIDRGDNSIYTGSMGTPNDLAGEVRFFNASSTQEAVIDMGAYEFEGTLAPFSISCKDLTVQLDASGQGTLEYSAFNNGSIGCAPLRFEVDGNTSLNYTCADIGSQTIMLTVTDDRQFTSSCNPSITISDDIAPMAACQDVTAQLDGSGSASVAVSSIDNGSSDACGIQSLVLSQSEFDCFSIGDNNVTLTVTDNSGNSASCTANVNIEESNALPSQWSANNIGNSNGNSFSFDPCSAADPANNEFNITGGGANGANPFSDALAFASQNVCGDFTFTAKIESVDPGGYAGLMVRETNDPGSKQFSFYSNLTNIILTQVRTITNGPKQQQLLYRPFPVWLRMQRLGPWLIAYYSPNGINFQYLYAVYLPLPDCVEVGMAVFTGSGNSANAVFSNVSIDGGAALAGGTPSDFQTPPSDFQTPTPDFQTPNSPELFPNPTRDAFTLSFPQALQGEATATLRNQIGQVVAQRQLQPDDVTTQWNVIDLPGGLYIMEVRQEGIPPQVLRVVKSN